MKWQFKNREEWHRWFSWLPAMSDGGAWYWLCTVERRWDALRNFRIIDPYDPGAYDGGWEYREVQSSVLSETA